MVACSLHGSALNIRFRAGASQENKRHAADIGKYSNRNNAQQVLRTLEKHGFLLAGLIGVQ